MDSRELFNFGLGLSRAQAGYDAMTPKEPESWPCELCDEEGCGACDWKGRVGYSADDLREQRASDAEDRRNG